MKIFSNAQVRAIKNSSFSLPEYLINLLFFVLFIFLAGNLSATGKSVNRTAEIDKEALKKAQEQKVVHAFRVNSSIKLDGLLEEEVWKTHEPVSDFLQRDPNDGEKASELTEVWVAYDDTNLYVAAYCHDSDPKGVIGLLGRRDSFVDSDWFFFAVDPYFDRRSGYLFGVNPSGSIVDEVLSNDVNEDESWDGIWEAKAARVADGWTLEMRIPFNQLRFPKKDVYVWGVNFQRTIKRKNEKVAFAWVPKEDNAYVSRFARLEGIEKINPGRRVELYPYSVGQAQFRPAEPGNPFETGHKYLGNAGFDLKVGLKSNLNLDVTVNPDFGQVEVDPAVINLSAYETYYQEKRPFFIEGASIFNNFGRGGVYLNANINWPNPRLFYSRRIGRQPQGYVTHDGYVSFPDRTTILGAFKLTGRVGSGWNVGFISALTGREFATVDDMSNRYQDEVEPLTYYGVLRVQKDINDGQQGMGFMATGVMRDLNTEMLSAILNKNAFSLAADGWSFLDKKRTWVVGGWIGGTFIQGSQDDIYRLQQSSTHYFQRPDATHVSLDPEATSLNGWGGQFKLAKQQGNSLFLFSAGALSPGFDPNDAGFQSSSSDVIDLMGLYGYQHTKPGKIFRQWLLIGGGSRQYDFGGNSVFSCLAASFQGVLNNWWDFEYTFIFMPESLNNRLTRGGPMALLPWAFMNELRLSSDSRKPVVLEGDFFYQRIHNNSYDWRADFAVRWKPMSNLSLSVGPQLGREVNETQWVTKVADPLMTETFGNRYVFGRIDQKIVAAEIRVNWIFTPKLSLQAYLQPFIAAGKYDRFKQLNRPRAYDYLVYGEGESTIVAGESEYIIDPDGSGPAASFSIYNPDFNYKSMRGTVVLRWEYRPGSLLYLVWTQNRADYSYPGQFSLWRDLGNLFTAPGDNIFLVKFSYRFEL
ncbi:MAG: carbohydrate binding family 9 domain-containing protein [Candidatus Aminicenantes bacterium]|nr:carbohydrate binding family 9 domain-containing protein [Candidatus Aminicenantes bacterium]